MVSSDSVKVDADDNSKKCLVGDDDSEKPAARELANGLLCAMCAHAACGGPSDYEL